MGPVNWDKACSIPLGKRLKNHQHKNKFHKLHKATANHEDCIHTRLILNQIALKIFILNESEQYIFDYTRLHSEINYYCSTALKV